MILKDYPLYYNLKKFHTQKNQGLEVRRANNIHKTVYFIIEIIFNDYLISSSAIKVNML